MYSAFECSRVAAGPDGSADRSQTDSRVLSSHDPKTGFPIDGLDRFASMSSSPLQFVNAVTSPLLFSSSPSPLGSFSKLRRPIGATMGQQRPGRARHLVGERHRYDLEGPPRQELREPEIFAGVLLGTPQHGDRPDDENAPQVAVALFGDRSELLLAPGRILPRHQPDPGREIASRAEHRRSATVATMAVAPITPMPGMASTRWLASLERCCILIRFSIAPMTLSNASSCAASTMTLARASIGNRVSCSSVTIARNSLTPALPCAATTPSSARCARKALMIWVRWRISTSRVRCCIN